MRDYDTIFPGVNARMPEFSALMGAHSLSRVEEAAEQRNAVANCYQDLLGDLPGLAFQEVHADDRCSYKDFSILVDQTTFGLSRDGLAKALVAENIDVRKYYDPPVHRQTAYRTGERTDLPVTDRLANGSLSLPIWSRMDLETCERIALALRCIRDHSDSVGTVIADSTE
jgi:dTDP-4-amino-4,6-dideoxygalactose transaminase